jgi:class 3 adenylate cyclase/tetratricopeptide (TPR) repeat protein
MPNAISKLGPVVLEATVPGVSAGAGNDPPAGTAECHRCGARNRAGVRFCEECGTRLEAHCPACRAPVRPGKPYCGNCGTALDMPGGALPRLQRPLPLELARRLQREGATAPEGERKQVTVLFADLKGSLELLADRDPEDGRRLIQPILEHMIHAAHKYGGTVNQVLGDGVMALFGAPVAHEDHAIRACHAALDMHSAIRSYGEELRRSQGLPLLQVRVGLNSGEVVVGSIGNDLHMEYTAVGQTTHLAARMEQLASPGATLLTSATLQLAEGYVSVRPHGLVNVKGLREPVEVYELTGRGVARSRLHAAAARGLSAFVGRGDEFASLERALERAGSSRGQVLALVGEPGVGKSRLMREFTRSYRTRGWALGEARCVAYGKDTAYQSVIDLLKAYFRICEGDDAARMREKVTDRLVALDSALRNSVTPLLGLLDAAGDDPEWARLDPLQRRQRILDAGRRLLLRESQSQPLVLVFEDLHWVDNETQALLSCLVDSLPQATILLLLTYRPGYQPPWMGRSHFSELRIEPLPEHSASELADQLLGTDACLDSVKQLLLSRTDGNPLFLEESVRALEETGAIEGERGAYRSCAPITKIQVPATVQAIIAARIDRLPEQHKRLLQSASVIGKDVPFVLLHAISGLSDDQVREGLGTLECGEFIYQASPGPYGEYTFKHGLTQEVAYGSLLLECRKALHGAVVSAIEDIYAVRLHEHTERLATHAIRGELWDKGALYARQSGAKAVSRSANREAVAAFDQALLALQHLPQEQSTLEQAIDIRCELRNALYPLGELGRLHDLLRDAARLAEVSGDRSRLQRVTSYLTHYFWATGRHRDAVASGERTLQGGVHCEHCPVELLASNWALGQAYHAVGRYDAAVEFFSGMLRRVEGDMIGSSFGSHGLPVVFARSWMTRALSEMGRFEEGLACAREGLRLAEVLDHPFSRYVANQGLGYLHLRRGAIGEALPYLQRSYEVCREWSLRIGYPTSAALLGYAYALAGRVADGVHLLSRALDDSRSIGVRFSCSLETAWLAEAHLLIGNLEPAQRLAAEAMQIALEQEERGHQAWILHLRGRIALAADDKTGAARTRFGEAQRIAAELQMRPLVEQCDRELAGLADPALTRATA